MKRFKPYTIGFIFSLLFHIPFVYFYLHSVKTLPARQIILDPILVHCAISTEAPTRIAALKLPPMSMPPREF